MRSWDALCLPEPVIDSMGSQVQGLARPLTVSVAAGAARLAC